MSTLIRKGNFLFKQNYKRRDVSNFYKSYMANLKNKKKEKKAIKFDFNNPIYQFKKVILMLMIKKM